MPKDKVYATTNYSFNNTEDDETQDKSVIVGWLTESNTTFTYMLGKIDVEKIKPDAYIIHVPWGAERVKKFGKMSFYPGPNDATAVADTIMQIKQMMDVNAGLIALLESEGTIKDYIAFRCAEEDDKTTFSISKLMVDDPPVCNICSDVVVYDDLADHQVGSSCLSQTTRNQAEANGLVLIEAEFEADLTKTTSVPYQMVPSSYDMWVPRWVESAITAYNKNKGFAGLTLTEYLDKLSALQVKK